MEARFKGFGDEFTEIFRRETGFSRPRSFHRRISGAEALVKRITLSGKLNGHKECVNTVEFNSSGDVLVSGSDDKQIIFWNLAGKSKTLSYPSGHVDNIFQARIMPFTDDRKVVTSSCDGQVRLGQVLENGRVDTKRLGKHQGRVYKLAVEPGSPHIFYSCGEDGVVQHFDLRSNSATKLFYCSSFTDSNRQPQNSIELNAIVINPRNPNYFALGGSDEYARVYDIRKNQCGLSNNLDRPVNTFCPHHLVKADVHITGLAYSNTSELLASYSDELIYLFQKDMGMGPTPLSVTSEELQKLEKPQVYLGHRNSQTVKGVSFFGPGDEYILSGSDCGHIFIWKKKDAKLVRLMMGDQHIVNHLEPHPYMPLFASCGIEKSIKLWVPSGDDGILPLPVNAEKILDSNRQAREDRSLVTLTPDVIMHVLRLQRRQTVAYIERRYNRADIDNDEEDEGEAYILGFSDGDASSEERCYIS